MSKCRHEVIAYVLKVVQRSDRWQKHTYLQRFLRSSLGGMEGIKGERSEQQSDRAENHSRNGIDLGYFDVEKVRFFVKDALCLHLELYFLCRRGAHFQKTHEKKLPESRKRSQNNVGYIKIPPKWGRIHEDGIKIMSDTSLKSPTEATCSKNTHICNVF